MKKIIYIFIFFTVNVYGNHICHKMKYDIVKYLNTKAYWRNDSVEKALQKCYNSSNDKVLDVLLEKTYNRYIKLKNIKIKMFKSSMAQLKRTKDAMDGDKLSALSILFNFQNDKANNYKLMKESDEKENNFKEILYKLLNYIK